MVQGLELYLVRHGIAADRGPEFPDDTRRPLTSEGKARFREVAGGLVAIGVELDEILTSPLVRTRQTAEILAKAWPQPPRVTDLEALAADRSPSDALAALVGHGDGQRLALVGHMPGIGVLAADLIGSAQPLDFKKGAVACIAVDKTPRRGGGRLLWYATPRILRKAAGARDK